MKTKFLGAQKTNEYIFTTFIIDLCEKLKYNSIIQKYNCTELKIIFILKIREGGKLFPK